MKKWVNRNWDEIQPGDLIRYRFFEGGYSAGKKIKHIGNEYARLLCFSSLWNRTRSGSLYQYQRYEEVELPDGWYLVELKPGIRTVRYKTGNEIYDGPDRRYPSWSIDNYKILKRARFEELEE